MDAIDPIYDSDESIVSARTQTILRTTIWLVAAAASIASGIEAGRHERESGIELLDPRSFLITAFSASITSLLVFVQRGSRWFKPRFLRRASKMIWSVRLGAMVAITTGTSILIGARTPHSDEGIFLLATGLGLLGAWIASLRYSPHLS